MAIVPWKPFSDLDRFFEDDENWLFPVIFKETALPPLNLYEEGDKLIAELSVPGVNPEQIEINIDNGLLKVSGKAEEKQEEKKKNYWRQEVRQQSFQRVVRLPATVDEDKVEATYDKGMLKIVMPKKTTIKAKEKKIAIKSGRPTKIK